MCQTRYTQEHVLQAAPAQCADARADLVHGGYLRHARALDARHHAGVRDPDEPGEATTCTLSVAHEMGATRRSSGGCSACTSPIFRSFYQFVKLAAHA